MAGYDDKNITAGCQCGGEIAFKMERIGKGTSGRNAALQRSRSSVAICSGSWPQRTTSWPFLARVMARAVPYERHRSQSLKHYVGSSGILMFFSTFASLLLQIVHEQRIEVNRRKVQLRECTAGYHAGDALTSIREQNVRAVCARQCAIWVPSIPAMEKIPPC